MCFGVCCDDKDDDDVCLLLDHPDTDGRRGGFYSLLDSSSAVQCHHKSLSLNDDLQLGS